MVTVPNDPIRWTALDQNVPAQGLGVLRVSEPREEESLEIPSSLLRSSPEFVHQETRTLRSGLEDPNRTGDLRDRLHDRDEQSLSIRPQITLRTMPTRERIRTASSGTGTSRLHDELGIVVFQMESVCR